ncbi:ubiquitin carboxyl-terminal hydrolase MINDY-2 isoform X3 [Rhineura floridana]|uniref:ubiquitin carboxyl-terminal hydrolase MINDY-2 isoform X3 n=1 Tax=Rhineura floridana TaxID=261503 RepID=UPI002AC83771|nr:ubiquitin carboxyl-terminal hydrolase MINDY-2 isoform X3 [Rhineura floridana]
MEGLAQLPPPPPAAPLGAAAVVVAEAGRVSPQEQARIASESRAAAASASEDGEAVAKRRAGSSSSLPSEAVAPHPCLEEPPRAASDRDTTTPESLSRAEATAAPASESGGEGGAGSGSGATSPAEDSLGSFSNLLSCGGPSSSDLNSGCDSDDSDEAAAARRAPVAGEEAGEAAAAPGSASPPPLGPVPPGAKERFPGQSVYHIKWVRWKEENTPVITQNENGPCPLLAIMNVLLLAWKIADIVKAVGNCSYNQLVEKIICCKQSDNSELVDEGSIAEQFLNNTATQLTYHGLCELTSTVQEGELCVFFRNNHFSTITKHKGQLYLLVTDQGFLTEDKVVWESLHNVDGDGNFCDSEFRLRPPSDPETVYRGQQDQIDQDYLMALSLQQEQQSQDINWEQIPEGISDLELAKKLQEEEDRRASQYYQEQEQAAAAATAAAQVQHVPGAASPSTGRQPGGSERKRKEPREKEKEPREKEKSSCAIL